MNNGTQKQEITNNPQKIKRNQIVLFRCNLEEKALNVDIAGYQDVWHELVLNGIGGATIEQAKRNMSWLEFNDWVKYRNKYGGLNTALRVINAIATLTTITANINSKHQFKINDFLDYDYKKATLDATQDNDLLGALLNW